MVAFHQEALLYRALAMRCRKRVWGIGEATSATRPICQAGSEDTFSEIAESPLWVNQSSMRLHLADRIQPAFRPNQESLSCDGWRRQGHLIQRIDLK